MTAQTADYVYDNLPISSIQSAIDEGVLEVMEVDGEAAITLHMQLVYGDGEDTTLTGTEIPIETYNDVPDEHKANGVYQMLQHIAEATGSYEQDGCEEELELLNIVDLIAEY